MVIRAIISEDRYGNRVYICPLCGHVFYSSKQYQRHLMRSHLHKKHRKKRVEKKIKKRGYIRSFERKKAEEEAKKLVEKVEEAKEKALEEALEKAKEVVEEIDLKPFREFVKKRAKGRKSVRFKITTLARELGISVEEAKKLVEAAEAKMKGDRVTVRLNERSFFSTMRCVFGGTFNVLHEGHKHVLSNAAKFCDELIIGLSSDEFAKLYGHKKVRPYAERKRDLEAFLSTLGIKYKIERLDDIFGPALGEVDMLIATEEVIMNALAVNRRRRAEGKKEIPILVFPVLKRDGKISASDMV